MLIKDMFAKPIDRDIKGVIKVGQADDENVKQELEEYVVTRELQKHFAEFFASYKRGINGYTDKMGVWISGFFGSGKSHFLKILSYLLENKEVQGKRAIDYFIDDDKIIDPMVLADMKLAASVPTDVILFNIDSKSEMTGKHSKDAIVLVFLKVFNEMQGFCGSIPSLADLERQLSEKQRYEEFKLEFLNEFGKPWVESRNKFDFIQDTIVDVLAKMNFMSEEAARNLCEKANEPYSISIEKFADLVKEYLDHKGENHHIVFLVDEMGQYIGDDSKLMLNLQTVTEDLGTACHGKAWIIVTSQQDIDTVIQVRGNDFSKIQGRFDTRLSLSSANVDEVIKKRILEKTMTGEQTLKLLYESKSTMIKNLIVFNNSTEKKLYANEQDFALVYPFVPYQFNLLASVLTSIRTHGASGKHLSEGERSMLALFKESAMRLMNCDHGALVPFNIFYDALHQFLDHVHKGVIIKAAENDYINPDNEEDCFNVNVLKTLFLIKYVDGIPANAENVTSLMISDIDTDRIALKARVEEALGILVRQMLVHKHGDNYIFLTNEEQEINREIENQAVEMADVISKVSEIIFEDIFSVKKYRYLEHNGRYNFSFNQKVDDRPYKANQNHAIGVHILTPNSEYVDDEITLRMISDQKKEVLVVLKDDFAFLDELRSALKIENYLRHTTANQLSKFEQIREGKQREMRERNGNAKLFLQDALKNAAIYVNGDRSSINTKDISARINDALGLLVSSVYHKLSYIDVAMSEANIRALFSSSKQQSVGLEDDQQVNPHAVHDVLGYIAGNSSMHTKTSMKSLLDRFMNAPYGFVEDDVEWIVAKLFRDGDIAFSVSGDAVTLINRQKEDIIRYITKKEYVEKLLIDRRQQAGVEEKKAVKDVMRELFGTRGINDDDDSIMQSFQGYGEDLFNELEKMELLGFDGRLPGMKTVRQGKGLLRGAIQIQSPSEFFHKVYSNRETFFEFAKAYEPVKAFYTGQQVSIFKDALKLMDIYDDSKTFIAEPQVEGTAIRIKEILLKDAPYGDIHQLPGLTNQFKEAYTSVLDQMTGPILQAVEAAKDRVFEVLDTKPYREELKDSYLKQFADVREKARTCNNVSVLQSVKLEVDTLKVRLLNEMAAKDVEVTDEPGAYVGGDGDPKPAVKKQRNISIKSVSLASSWRIEKVEDLDRYIQELKDQIKKELDEDTIINIEF